MNDSEPEDAVDAMHLVSGAQHAPERVDDGQGRAHVRLVQEAPLVALRPSRGWRASGPCASALAFLFAVTTWSPDARATGGVS